MATATRIPIEQYLMTSYEPDAELCAVRSRDEAWASTITTWCNGQFWIGSGGTIKNGKRALFRSRERRLNSDTVRIPDVSVWARTVPIEPVFSHPQLIVVEVLSPEDRHSKVQEKVEDYRRFQVPHIWVVDPLQRMGWDCSDGNWMRTSRFRRRGFTHPSRSRAAFQGTGCG